MLEKRSIPLLVILALSLRMLNPHPVLAQEDFVFDAPSGTIIAYTGSSTNVVIPEAINGISVSAIGEGAFEYNSVITNVTIPSSVAQIGDYAFNGCSSLVSISVDAQNSNYASESGVLFNKEKTALLQCPAGKAGEYLIPNGVTSIGSSAFERCAGMTALQIPDTVSRIGTYAFYDCTALSSLTVPSGVTNIPDGMAWNCASLTAVSLSENTEKVGVFSFYNCPGLKTIRIPDKVTSISWGAFYGGEGVSVLFEGNAPTIGSGAFSRDVRLSFRPDSTGFTTPVWEGYACTGTVRLEDRYYEGFETGEFEGGSIVNGGVPTEGKSLALSTDASNTAVVQITPFTVNTGKIVVEYDIMKGADTRSVQVGLVTQDGVSRSVGTLSGTAANPGTELFSVSADGQQAVYMRDYASAPAPVPAASPAPVPTNGERWHHVKAALDIDTGYLTYWVDGVAGGAYQADSYEKLAYPVRFMEPGSTITGLSLAVGAGASGKIGYFDNLSVYDPCAEAVRRISALPGQASATDYEAYKQAWEAVETALEMGAAPGEITNYETLRTFRADLAGVLPQALPEGFHEDFESFDSTGYTFPGTGSHITGAGNGSATGLQITASSIRKTFATPRKGLIVYEADFKKTNDGNSATFYAGVGGSSVELLTILGDRRGAYGRGASSTAYFFSNPYPAASTDAYLAVDASRWHSIRIEIDARAYPAYISTYYIDGVETGNYKSDGTRYPVSRYALNATAALSAIGYLQITALQQTSMLIDNIRMYDPAADAMQVIGALPAEVTLGDKEAVDAARSVVDKAVAMGVKAYEIVSLPKLELAEQAIVVLSEAFQTDHINNIPGRNVIIKCPYDVTAIRVNGTAITDYSVADGSIMIAGSVFATEGNYTVVLSLDDGSDVELVQPIKAQPGEILVNNDTSDENIPGYEDQIPSGGAWAQSGAAKGHDGVRPTKYAVSADNAWAKWTPDIPLSGTYGVYFYRVYYANNTKEALLTVNSGAGVSKRLVNILDQESGWEYLGDYFLKEGTSANVLLSRGSEGVGVMRTSAVKFVYRPGENTVLTAMELRSEGQILSDLSEDTESVEFSAAMYNDGANPAGAGTMYAARYTGDGTMQEVKVIPSPQATILPGKSVVYTGEFSQMQPEKGDCLAFYFWDGELSPLSSPYKNIFIPPWSASVD